MSDKDGIYRMRGPSQVPQKGEDKGSHDLDTGYKIKGFPEKNLEGSIEEKPEDSMSEKVEKVSAEFTYADAIAALSKIKDKDKDLSK